MNDSSTPGALRNLAAAIERDMPANAGTLRDLANEIEAHQADRRALKQHWETT